MLNTQRLPRPFDLRTGLLALAAAALALMIALAVGNPTFQTQLAMAVIVGLGVLGYVTYRPYVGFLILCGSCFFLIVIAATLQRYVNAFDAMMPLVLGVSVLGRAREEARARDALESGPIHAAIREAGRGFLKASVIYWALAALSVFNLLRTAGMSAAVESTYSVVRSVETALMFPLALWWIRGARELRQTYWAIVGFTMFFAFINFIQVLAMHAPRAGITWVASQPSWPVEGPNEAGAALVIVWALIMADHTLRPRWYNLVMFAVILIMEVLTQSRSGLLALLTFNLLIMRRVPTRYLVLAVLLVAITLPLAPASWWQRMIKTVALERGSQEMFSWLMRVYAYITAFKVIAANWLIGIGYMGFRFVSDQNNSLHYKIGQCENWMLEVAVSMGIVGVVVATRWFVKLIQLGQVVRRATVPGTFGNQIARLHVPLVIGLAVANLTGETLVGLVGIGQIAIWSAMVLRGGHIDARSDSPLISKES